MLITRGNNTYDNTGHWYNETYYCEGPFHSHEPSLCSQPSVVGSNTFRRHESLIFTNQPSLIDDSW